MREGRAAADSFTHVHGMIHHVGSGIAHERDGRCLTSRSTATDSKPVCAMCSWPSFAVVTSDFGTLTKGQPSARWPDGERSGLTAGMCRLAEQRLLSMWIQLVVATFYLGWRGEVDDGQSTTETFPHGN